MPANSLRPTSRRYSRFAWRKCRDRCQVANCRSASGPVGRQLYEQPLAISGQGCEKGPGPVMPDTLFESVDAVNGHTLLQRFEIDHGYSSVRFGFFRRRNFVFMMKHRTGRSR